MEIERESSRVERGDPQFALHKNEIPREGASGETSSRNACL